MGISLLDRPICRLETHRQVVSGIGSDHQSVII
jgi:hypothetical protein